MTPNRPDRKIATPANAFSAPVRSDDAGELKPLDIGGSSLSYFPSGEARRALPPPSIFIPPTSRPAGALERRRFADVIDPREQRRRTKTPEIPVEHRGVAPSPRRQ